MPLSIFRRICEHGSQRIGGLTIGLLHKVSIDTERGGRIGMAQTAADRSDRHAGGQ